MKHDPSLLVILDLMGADSSTGTLQVIHLLQLDSISLFGISFVNSIYHQTKQNMLF